MQKIHKKSCGSMITSVLVIMLSLVLAGCGDDTRESERQNSQPTAPTDPESAQQSVGELVREEMSALRDLDIAIMEWRGQNIGEGNVKKDPDPEAPFRLVVIQDKTHKTVSRVKADLNRDGVIDEMWLFRRDSKGVLIKTDPSIEGKFRKEYEWSKGIRTEIKV